MKLGAIASVIAASALLALGSACGGGGDNGPGVGIAVFAKGWVSVIDPVKQDASAPLLVGELGVPGNELLDAVITKDGRTALVSSFSQSWKDAEGNDKSGGRIYVLDLSKPASPQVLGSVTLSFYAEDIDLTPDGRFALVSDGGFSPKIAVIDVAARALVEEFPPTPPPTPTVSKTAADTSRLSSKSAIARADEEPYTPYYNAVAIAADGRTVLGADYFNGKVNVLTLSATGHLTYVKALDMPSEVIPDSNPPATTPVLRPINLSISPDGRTAIVAAGLSATDAEGKPAFDQMAFPVLKITGPGQVEMAASVKPSIHLRGAQSVAFSPSGRKAYVNCVREMPVPEPAPTSPEYPRNVIVELDITAPGVVKEGGAPMDVDFIGTSQLFGVDTLAVDARGNGLYVSNMTESGFRKHIQVLDLKTRKVVKTLAFDAKVTMPPATEGGTPTEEDAIPAGLFFSRP